MCALSLCPFCEIWQKGASPYTQEDGEVTGHQPSLSWGWGEEGRGVPSYASNF